MSWWGWLLLVAAVFVVAMIMVVGWIVVRLARTVREVGTALDELRTQTMPLLADTRAALRKAEGANRKTDVLIDTATSVTETLDSATKLAHSVLSNPLVKVLSFFTGTKHAARRLRSATAPGGAAPKAIERASTRAVRARDAKAVLADGAQPRREIEASATTTEKGKR
jgi:uncharacterized protein YoxC